MVTEYQKFQSAKELQVRLVKTLSAAGLLGLGIVALASNEEVQRIVGAAWTTLKVALFQTPDR